MDLCNLYFQTGTTENRQQALNICKEFMPFPINCI